MAGYHAASMRRVDQPAYASTSAYVYPPAPPQAPSLAHLGHVAARAATSSFGAVAQPPFHPQLLNMPPRPPVIHRIDRTPAAGPLRYTPDGYALSSTAPDPGAAPPRPQQTYECLGCTRTPFQTLEQLIVHKSKHVRCDHPGCAYEGVPGALRTHREDRHLIFEGQRQVELSEEEARFAGKSIAVPGTSIRLDTSEAIEKWIADRKRRYPTTSRDVAPAPAPRRAPPMPSYPLRIPVPPTTSQATRPVINAARLEHISQPEETSTRPTLSYGRGRGRGRGGSSESTRGRGGGGPAGATSSNRTPLPPRPAAAPAKATAIAGLGGYETGEDSDDEPPEVVSAAQPPGTASVPSSEPAQAVVEPGEVEARPAKRARLGKSERGKAKVVGKPKKLPTQPKAPPPPAAIPQHGLLGKLLAMEIEHDMSDLAQVVDFLVRNDFLRDVELKPGESEAAIRVAEVTEEPL